MRALLPKELNDILAAIADLDGAGTVVHDCDSSGADTSGDNDNFKQGDNAGDYGERLRRLRRYRWCLRLRLFARSLSAC